MRQLHVLLFALSTLLLATHPNHGHHMRSKRSKSRLIQSIPFHNCYSCANYELKTYWHYLQMLYNNRKNFTDECLEMSDSGRRMIAVELCDSKCVTLKETKLINGLVVGYNVIRGCLTTMFRWNPLNRYSLEIIAGKSKGRCQELSASDLMPSLSKVKVHSNPVTLCSCLGDLCNGGVRSSHSCTTRSLLLCLSAMAITMTMYLATLS